MKERNFCFSRRRCHSILKRILDQFPLSPVSHFQDSQKIDLLTPSFNFPNKSAIIFREKGLYFIEKNNQEMRYFMCAKVFHKNPSPNMSLSLRTRPPQNQAKMIFVLLTQGQLHFARTFQRYPHLTIFGTFKYATKYGQICQLRYLGRIFGCVKYGQVSFP